MDDCGFKLEDAYTVTARCCGSCTLTDESDACIEYVDCSEEGILSLLVGMAPSRLTVYDLSGGSSGLAETIARVFSGRVRIYR